jgi:hypothetical protein
MDGNVCPYFAGLEGSRVERVAGVGRIRRDLAVHCCGCWAGCVISRLARGGRPCPTLASSTSHYLQGSRYLVMATSSTHICHGLVLRLGILGEPRHGSLKGGARESWRRSRSPRCPVLDDMLAHHLQVELE